MKRTTNGERQASYESGDDQRSERERELFASVREVELEGAGDPEEQTGEPDEDRVLETLRHVRRRSVH